MEFTNMEQFFKQHLRFKQHWNKKVISMHDAVWQTLTANTWIDGCEYAAGSQFKVFETTNFGWIVFGPETKTPDGNTPGKRIIKW
jgi:hypothetical protein